jgi:preprotein translocase subunit SecG
MQFTIFGLVLLLAISIVLALVVRRKTQQLDKLESDYEQLRLSKAADERKIEILENRLNELEWRLRQKNTQRLVL